MRRVHVVVAVLVVLAALSSRAAPAEATAEAPVRSGPPPSGPPATPILAFMGSVDYGGQPPSSARIPVGAVWGATGFPVDRRPDVARRPWIPAGVGPPTNAGGELTQSQSPDGPAGQPDKHPLSFWQRLVQFASKSAQAVGKGIHDTVDKTKSLFGR